MMAMTVAVVGATTHFAVFCPAPCPARHGLWPHGEIGPPDGWAALLTLVAVA